MNLIPYMNIRENVPVLFCTDLHLLKGNEMKKLLTLVLCTMLAASCSVSVFTPDTHIIKFNLNYSSTFTIPADQKLNAGEKVVAPTVPARTGYIFNGWFRETACTSEWIFSTDTVQTDQTLYAKWTVVIPPSSFMVTFNLNYTGATGAPPMQTIAAGGLASVPVAPVRTGFSFGAWYREDACTSVWTFASDTITASTTLYAKWTAAIPPSSFTVSFNLNYPGATGAPPTQTVASGAHAVQPTAPARLGYTFGAWYREVACIIAWNFSVDTLTSKRTLYAKWNSVTPPSGPQIIADHTIVDRYAAIPQSYINIVKSWLVDIAGESHSSGYRIGINLLETIDSKFAVQTFDGSVPAATSANLRLGRHGAVGEEDFYTNTTAIADIKQLMTNQKTAGNPLSVLGFGWCWDMTWTNAPDGTIDPVYDVRWAGSSAGGPQGNLVWGLDAGDQTQTGNSVCMDTYLNAVMSYIAYCTTNAISTRVIFTTGPVDGNGGTENGFQREIKHDYIRAFVTSHPETVLFDYADILCWNDGGVKNTDAWNDGGVNRTHAQIHADNMKDYDASWNMIASVEDGDHIGEVGTLRLAKAMWWMLARMAGWDGASL